MVQGPCVSFDNTCGRVMLVARFNGALTAFSALCHGFARYGQPQWISTQRSNADASHGPRSCGYSCLCVQNRYIYKQKKYIYI